MEATTPSRDTGARDAAAPRPRDPGPCPVRAIGLRGGTAYFFDRLGQLRDLGAQALGQPPQILFLFGGTAGADWLRNKFPHFDKEGNWTNGFNARDCNAWLVEQCSAAGLFDPDKLPIRGHGVWRADDAIAVHVGNEVMFTPDRGHPETQPAGFRARGALWPAQPPLPPPAPACDAATAQQVERLFGRWHWWNPGEERVFTGLWVAGLLGAAIGWRPHGMLIGPAGSGKSTLLDLYAILSPLAVAVNDYTAAGVRQMLTGRAAPLILDEADEDPETMGRLQQVISLLRRASGGAGARVVRGTGDGHAMRYDFMSQTILGAVLSPPLLPQDTTRITRMELIRIPDGAEPLRLDDMTAWCRRQAPALWGRALAGIPRFRHNLTEIRRAMLGRGCSPRLADQVGTILAARAMILEDEPLDALAAEEDILAVSWLIRTREEMAEEDGPARCLQHLLASQADALESGARPTFSALIDRSLRAADDDARRKLIDHGLKVGRYPHAPPGREWLLVANTHPQLTRVFAGTHWAGGRWTGDLKRLPGAVVPSNSVSFRLNSKFRCVAIPAECFDPDDDSGIPAGHPMPSPVPHAVARLSVH